jgi:hypothetical protein
MFDGSNSRVNTAVHALSLLSVYGAGWTVAHTVVPAWAFEMVATLLVLAPVAVGLAVARAAGFELSPGQCRAATNSGDRCSRTRPPNRDLCWQHRRLHDVSLHPEGIAEKRADEPLPTGTFRE